MHTGETQTDATASVPPATPPAVPSSAWTADLTASTDVIDPPGSPRPALPSEPSEPSAAPVRRRRLARDLGLLTGVGVLLLAALGAAAAAAYQDFYSPTAFVLRYVQDLAGGHTADALAIPGVSVDSSALEASGLPLHASDALLRPAALGTLADVHVISTADRDGETFVTIGYRAGGHRGTTEFAVERDGWIGIVPAWRFARSPLAVVDLTVRGSMQFSVNGFEVDKRQASDEASENPLAPVPLLVFSPGLYSVTVDTPIAETSGVAVLANSSMTSTPIDVQAMPTANFQKAITTRVDDFLAKCATQQVLQPTACPFGYVVENRVIGLPTWSIVAQPPVNLQPDGEGWRIQTTTAVAHIRVDVRSIFDGSVKHVDEDVPFFVTGTVTIQPDGSAAISVVPPDTD